MKIACMGDSITLGVGLPGHQGRWTDLVSERTGHTLVNFGIGGDTTGGMLARCQTQIFNQDFDAMILLGGSNDISYEWEYRHAWSNIITIYRQAKALGIPLIMGIPVPMIAEDLGFLTEDVHKLREASGYPGTCGSNWTWRVTAGGINGELAERIYNLTRTYGRL